MKIAICDDQTQICLQLQTSILSHMNKKNITCEISIFTSAKNLMLELKDGIFFDAIFLDIEFPEEKSDGTADTLAFENGISIGNYLRKELAMEATQLVYISAKESYALQLFDTRPLNFLIKPFDLEKLSSILDQIIRLNQIDGDTFSFHLGRQHYRLYLSQIQYFQADNHHIRIVYSDMPQQDEKIEFSGKLREIEKELADKDFFSPHKSYLVNYHAVIKWSPEHLTIKNGDVIPVSRNNQKKLLSIQLEKSL